MDPSGPLRPLDESADFIRRLQGYHTLEELGTALERVHAAIQEALRLRLRLDPDAPEAERLRALSDEQLPIRDVIRSLRARDRISLRLAGTLHEMDGVVARARAGEARPADADVGLAAVHRVRQELLLEATAETPARVAPAEATAGEAAGEAARPPASPGIGRWMAWLGAALAIVVLVGFGWVLLRRPVSDMDAAITAFRAGRLDSAEVLFERTVNAAPDNVDALLYLARIQRRRGHPEAAANTLKKAVAAAPEDADVRRELGHLFVDLGRSAMAVKQYQRAVDAAPDDATNWLALVRAQRAAGDPRADSTLARAPADVQAALRDEGG